MFWLDHWRDDILLKDEFSRLFALESNKQISVQEKLVNGLLSSLRRNPRGGAESTQMEHLAQAMNSVVLRDEPDCWIWPLDATGCFSAASTRRYIEDQQDI
ncbi:RNA-directed DNA polymerase, eukaryota [Artemisia annua]|uniref:RNA-directed DNA polymerase, eukaryota n=1 Tax=Artemisia annua TaxID=35608 RepID=A0A2U1N0T5_ARTAN|nr:RNA-directed DNA polymerase, eukaryota [Artemisia annua]